MNAWIDADYVAAGLSSQLTEGGWLVRLLPERRWHGRSRILTGTPRAEGNAAARHLGRRVRRRRPAPCGRPSSAKGKAIMPLVRIDLIEGRTDEEVKALADAVQDVMMAVFAAPPRDRYQVIHEHRPGRLIVEDSGLGLDRSDRVVVIQVTEQGRSEAQKKAVYCGAGQRSGVARRVRPSDLVVSVVDSTRADWSFGLGRAQFLEGDL